MKAQTVTEDHFQKSVIVADSNWQAWKDVFEHQGPAQTNPLFEKERFAQEPLTNFVF